LTARGARATGIINEHDESEPDANDELYLVLEGRAVFPGVSESPLPDSNRRPLPTIQVTRGSACA